MSNAPKKFAAILSTALKIMKAKQNKPLSIIQDEIGYQLGRSSGRFFIEYLRKGHVPTNTVETERLAQLLVQGGGFMEQAICEGFLRSADHPQAAHIASRLFNENGRTFDMIPASFELQPFVVGSPITAPIQFFGRERQLMRVFQGWYRLPLQNVAIVGPRCSGKTSLLHHLRNIMYTPVAQLRANQHKEWLKFPQQYRWAVVDFQDPRLVKPQFLLPHLLRELGCPVPTPCTLETFMEVMIDHLQAPTIILMDELAAALAAPDLDMAFWYSLRSLVNTYANGRIAFLLTSHIPPFEIAADVGKPSPFFNMFNLVELGPWQADETQALIASSPIPFSAEDTAWIMQNSANWPVLVQLFCHERLLSLENGQQDDSWQQSALRRAAAYKHLLV